MKDERNFVFRVGWLYGIVVLLANLFANVVQVVIPSPIDDSFDFVIWRQFLSDNSFLSWISMLSYVVPTAFCIGYAYKNLRNLACRKKTFLSIPLVFSFLLRHPADDLLGDKYCRTRDQSDRDHASL